MVTLRGDTIDVMAGESQRIPGSDPDPSVQTQAAIDRAALHHAELVDQQIATIVERLNGMDKATELLSETVNRTPTEIQKEVGHLRELVERDVAAVQLRFEERDKRFGIQDSDAKERVDAALRSTSAMQALQESANSKAIEKAERATQEAINKNADLANKSIDAVREVVNDLKDRVVTLESEKRGVREKGLDNRAMIALGISVMFAIIGLVSFIIAMIERAGGTP